MAELQKKFIFSEGRLKDLPIPEKGKRIEFQDERSAGLYLRVTHTGVKTFYSRCYLARNDSVLRIKLGRFPETPIAHARKLNARNRQLVEQNIDPTERERKAKEELTLGELFDTLVEDFYKEERPKSLYYYQRHFQTKVTNQGRNNREQGHLYSWRRKKLSEISRQDLVRLKNKVAKTTGRGSANDVLRLIHSLFNKARDYGFVGPNPAEGITKYQSKSRERKLERHEVQPFFQALFGEQNVDVRDIVLILVLTGVRKTNVLSMRWEDINLQEKTWHIPDTKNNESQTVPLVGDVLSILEQRRGNDPTFVFPANSRTGHVVNVQKGWRRVVTAAGLENFRIHDLRRTFGSWQINAGSTLAVVGKSLNHKSLQSTTIYARLNIDPVRESVERGTGELLRAAGDSFGVSTA